MTPFYCYFIAYDRVSTCDISRRNLKKNYMYTEILINELTNTIIVLWFYSIMVDNCGQFFLDICVALKRAVLVIALSNHLNSLKSGYMFSILTLQTRLASMFCTFWSRASSFGLETAFRLAKNCFKAARFWRFSISTYTHDGVSSRFNIRRSRLTICLRKSMLSLRVLDE